MCCILLIFLPKDLSRVLDGGRKGEGGRYGVKKGTPPPPCLFNKNQVLFIMLFIVLIN